MGCRHPLGAVANPKILKTRGRKTIFISHSSFIANAHNELFAFCTEKRQLFGKKSEPIGDGRPHRPL